MASNLNQAVLEVCCVSAGSEDKGCQCLNHSYNAVPGLGYVAEALWSAVLLQKMEMSVICLPLKSATTGCQLHWIACMKVYRTAQKAPLASWDLDSHFFSSAN